MVPESLPAQGIAHARPSVEDRRSIDRPDLHVWKGITFTMAASYGFTRFLPAQIRSHSRRIQTLFATLLIAIPAFCVLSAEATAQTTTISGTVYDPRTTAAALPLPNVLVYVTTGAVAPLPSGVQCLTSSSSTPAGVVSYTNTAVDGTFILANVPVNATYTLVIQAGKWRRQFQETVGATPLTGLVLNMPANHTQGDIPMIAIATGSVDALECVLLDMGVSPTEFTDDNGVVNPGGHIHLYKGSSSPGAQISSATPNQSTLMTNSTTMDGYDVLMFPCQGNAANQASQTGATNLLNFANTGGRVFATHFSYAWLDPASPYDSQFPPIANWDVNQSDPTPDPGAATINTGFADGATLAQWLFNSGASTTAGQVQLSTLRHDLTSVIAPTQPWAALNNNGDIMQMTFNTPVGAPAASQCGRVLFNEYHVYSSSISGANYNAALPNGQTFSECSQQPHTMTPQEEMLEYALFDLSSFVTPVVVPTLSITFNPSPLVVKGGDTADQVAVDVTNTSSTTEVYSTVVLTLTLPAGLTATALTDPTGGWTCAVGTLTCTRTTSIAAGASDSVTLTVSVPAYSAGSAPSGVITATASSPNFSNNVVATDNVVFQTTPVLSWATPAPIVYGTALGATQLDATSTVQGSFTYSPAAGVVLPVGQQTLNTTFTPADLVDYTTATASVTLTVLPVTPSMSLTANANPVFLSNPVSFTATIASLSIAPTGTVTFYDGGTQIGTGTVTAGSATYTTSALSAGAHSITASYSGDSTYGPAAGGPISELVEDFTIVASNGGTSSVPATALASFPIVITPVGGPTLPGGIAFTVTGLSLGATGSFTPTTIAAGSPATTVTLQVQLPGSAALEQKSNPFGPTRLPIALCLILLPFARRLRKGAKSIGAVAMLSLLGAALALGVGGCGGASPNAQSYTLTVTAASGPLSHSTSLTLTVQ